jgi:hypothetical protein
MTRRRKFKQHSSKQLSSAPLSSIPNRQKPFSRRQRRRIRRQQRRRKIRTRSLSLTTQIATDAFDMLHISTTESNTKPFEFIERYELTRQHALAMPCDQRPIVFFMEPKNNRVFSNTTNDLYISTDEDYYSSYA